MMNIYTDPMLNVADAATYIAMPSSTLGAWRKDADQPLVSPRMSRSRVLTRGSSGSRSQGVVSISLGSSSAGRLLVNKAKVSPS